MRARGETRRAVARGAVEGRGMKGGIGRVVGIGMVAAIVMEGVIGMEEAVGGATGMAVGRRGLRSEAIGRRTGCRRRILRSQLLFLPLGSQHHVTIFLRYTAR